MSNLPLTVDRHVARHARQRPGATALEFKGRAHDYAALERAVHEWAGRLSAHGVGAGTRVLLLAERGPGWVGAHLALLRLGAVSVPLDQRAAIRELSHTLGLIAPRFALCDQARRSALDQAQRSAGVSCARLDLDSRRLHPAPVVGAPRPRPEPAADPVTVGEEARTAASDLAVLLSTSGTTGRPKAVMLTRGNLASLVDSLLAAWELGPEDRLVHVLPLFHVHGLLVALHTALAAGACVLLEPRFEAQHVWHTLCQRRSSVFMGVPTMYHRLLACPPAEPISLPHLRLCTCGSAPLPAERLEAFERLTGQRILERYGLSEAGMVSGNPLHGERRAGTVGFDLPGVTTRLVDPASGSPVRPGERGEVQVRGASVFPGYLDQPDTTRAAFSSDGWLRTGDIGQRDEAGALMLLGRLKELVISGGHNVSPAEVEAVLKEHPGVAEAGVYGIPDEDLGERVAAAIVPAADGSPSVEELIDFCGQRLARYKCPREIHGLTSLPRNALGKLQRGRLAARVEQTR